MGGFTSTDIEKEIWKDIPGYEDSYQVSDLGRVKSLERSIIKSNGVTQSFSEKVLKLNKIPDGYCLVSLSTKEKGIRTFEIHVLSAMAFKGHKPSRESNKIIDHLDGNKLNNRESNLDITSNRNNTIRGGVCMNSKIKSVGVRSAGKSKFKAVIRPTGQNQVHLGTFSTEKEASDSYKKALTKVLIDEDFCRKNEMTPDEWRKYLLL